MWAWLNELDSGYRLAAIIVAMVMALAAIGIVAQSCRRIKESADRAKMLGEMLRRGMSAEEITRILLAVQVTADESSEDEIDPDETPEAYVVKCLTDGWYGAEDIKQVLDAAHSHCGLDESTISIIETLAEGGTDTESIVQVLESRQKKAIPTPS